MLSFRPACISALRISWFRRRNGEGGFGAANIFEAVVGAHRNRILSRRESNEIAEREFILLFWRIADGTLGRDQNPITTIQTILGALDVGRSITRRELNDGGNQYCAADRRNDRHSFEVLDDRRSVVHDEALALTCSVESSRGGIRRRVTGDNLQIVSSVRQRGGIPRIEFLLEVVIQ